MSFVSLGFFIFFPIVTVLYFLLPHRFRWMLLLSASCVFYMAFIPAYLLILFALILVDYVVGLAMGSVSKQNRTYLLLVSIFSLVGILFFFKYFNFINTNLELLAEFIGWNYSTSLLAIALPVGLSFHTFQSLSYVIEVYRGNQKPERNLGIYALYVMFYPQLVAGPIERPQQMLYQFYENHVFEYERVRLGLIRMAWGFFKKMVVADRIGIVVNHVFADPYAFDGPSLALASVFFALEIYFDFSGYCDIALGASQVMGFRLVENFNRPYAARTINEFWRRWHISLSSWFRDYVYIPLGGNRVSLPRYALNILVVFLISGLWHGANWTYVVWGGLHGGFILLGSATAGLRERFANLLGLSQYPTVRDVVQIISTFALVTGAFIFFRAQSLPDAWYIVTNIFSNFSEILHPGYVSVSLSAVGSSIKSLCLSLVLVSLIFFLESRSGGAWTWISERSLLVRWAIYWAMLFSIIALNQSASATFIYFQF